MLRFANLSRGLVAGMLLLGAAGGSRADVVVGGQPMLPSKTIVDNAVNSADHTTLVAAVAAAGLVDTLKGAGPFTVFAPVNRAFEALPAGTVDKLLKSENRAALTSILTYHVVPGRLDWRRCARASPGAAAWPSSRRPTAKSSRSGPMGRAIWWSRTRTAASRQSRPMTSTSQTASFMSCSVCCCRCKARRLNRLNRTIDTN